MIERIYRPLSVPDIESMARIKPRSMVEESLPPHPRPYDRPKMASACAIRWNGPEGTDRGKSNSERVMVK